MDRVAEMEPGAARKTRIRRGKTENRTFLGTDPANDKIILTSDLFTYAGQRNTAQALGMHLVLALFLFVGLCWYHIFSLRFHYLDCLNCLSLFSPQRTLFFSRSWRKSPVELTYGRLLLLFFSLAFFLYHFLLLSFTSYSLLFCDCPPSHIQYSVHAVRCPVVDIHPTEMQAPSPICSSGC